MAYGYNDAEVDYNIRLGEIMFRWVLVVVFGALALWGVSIMRDPYRTALPLDVSDLSPIQKPLSRLPESDRQLVLGYLQRSRGDVLPPQFADPDEPFTARNFAQAIKLQKQFLERDKVRVAQLKAREAEREKAMAPLRAALGIQMVKREIVSRSDVVGSPLFSSLPNGRVAKRPIDPRMILMTTYRLSNDSGYTGIQSIKASVTVRKAGSSRYDLAYLESCYISNAPTIPSGTSIEVRCANLNREAGVAERAYVDMPESDLVIDWEPKQIRFSDGKELVASD